MEAKTTRIRALNDGLRQNLSDGHAFMTPGVAALGAGAVPRIVKTIQVCDDLCQANAPPRCCPTSALRAWRPAPQVPPT